MGNGVSMLALSFLIKSSSRLLLTRTGIKAQTSSILGLWFPWPIYMFFEMRFGLGTLDLGERSLPFGLLVYGASMGQGNKCLLGGSGSHDQDGRNTHIWYAASDIYKIHVVSNARYFLVNF